ncbi:hypothetical protein F4808DRAFT_420188 [Astrocystis sublimbata]|nr:hypothetical protein F4808DRAFT_420188 [Astrocystis sublimbata]
MKVSVAPTLASLLLLSCVSADDIPQACFYPYRDYQSLSDAKCKDVFLEDNHILHANCSNQFIEESQRTYTETTIDLNNCYANYQGHMTHVKKNGGFNSTCACEPINPETFELTCSCYRGKCLKGVVTNTIKLDDWQVLQLLPEGGGIQFITECFDLRRIERC